MTSDRMHE